MRTNIEIDDELMKKAMLAGPYQTKKEAVEAGLKLLARQVTYREIIKWRGKLKWEGDESIDWTKPEVSEPKQEPEANAELMASDARPADWPAKPTRRQGAPSVPPGPKAKRRAGR